MEDTKILREMEEKKTALRAKIELAETELATIEGNLKPQKGTPTAVSIGKQRVEAKKTKVASKQTTPATSDDPATQNQMQQMTPVKKEMTQKKTKKLN